jgi:hypothetical protein
MLNQFSRRKSRSRALAKEIGRDTDAVFGAQYNHFGGIDHQAPPLGSFARLP